MLTKTFTFANIKIFKIGDKVLLQEETLRRRRSKKLEAPWTGLYRVTEKLSDMNYKNKKSEAKNYIRTR